MKRHLTRLVVFATVLTIGTMAWAGTSASLERRAAERAAVERHSRSTAANLVDRLEQLGGFSTLLTALRTANLEDAVATGGPFTVFAPTDDAFADLLAELQITLPELLANPDLANILLYHVAPGSLRASALLKTSTQPTLFDGRPVLVELEGTSVLVNRAGVDRANVMAGNGIIHVIDKVLLPPSEPVSISSLLDVLQLDGRFTVLLEALSSTGLDDALAADGTFTIFAPTDEAFGLLLTELNITVEQLLADPNLDDILLYHALERRARSIERLVGQEVPTLQGDEVTVSLQQGGVYVNDARVITPNVNAPNALIHAIDKVLLP